MTLPSGTMCSKSEVILCAEVCGGSRKLRSISKYKTVRMLRIVVSLVKKLLQRKEPYSAVLLNKIHTCHC